jgi:2-polyprenyl-3-methyl-5-hydroxy-6-metoxy-1,4-benzoquinol methylase
LECYGILFIKENGFMETKLKKVETFYDQYNEWERLNRHRIEFLMTKKMMDIYIKKETLDILDIGGGPGRYSLYLGGKGHHVTLLDLSHKNIEEAKIKANTAGINIERYICGNALTLEDYSLGEFDVILLMGPLYHLIGEQERRLCLEQALGHLKTGGIIIATWISKYAPIIDNLKYLESGFEVESLLRYLSNGINDENEGFTTAYFEDPERIIQEMESYHLQTMDFIGIENILSTRETDLNKMNEEDFNKWLKICIELSRDKNLWGMSEHFLYVGRKEEVTDEIMPGVR